MTRVNALVVGIGALSMAMLSVPRLGAQPQAPTGALNPVFDVVSIKPHTGGDLGNSIRNMPDGTFTMTNMPLSAVILNASPVPVREFVGLPDWGNKPYDVTVRPPAGSTSEQRSDMWRNMFAERMKLVGHVEERERGIFALVLARGDGRLGPQLKRSTLDCTASQLSPASIDPENRCGGAVGRSSIVSGGMAMEQLAARLVGLAGGQVYNRTGLEGWYALTLRFTRPADPTPTDDAPDIFTALQEQLGLKLQPEKTMVPVFVIDHIEPPTPN